ncbi:MAG: glycoside hydrolase family 36 protein [Thermoanaerobaculia bacterium]
MRRMPGGICRLRVPHLGIALAALLGALPTLGAPPAYVSFDPETVTWRIGNARVERAVTLDADGHFYTASFVDKASGREWAAPDSRSGEFRISFIPASGADPVPRTGLATWRLGQDARTIGPDGTAELALLLLSQGDGLAVTVHYRCFPEAPVIETWLDVANEGDAPITLAGADAFRVQVQGDNTVPDALWVHNFTWDHPELAFWTEVDTLDLGEKSEFSTGPFGDGAAWFALRGTGGGAGLFGGWEWSGTGTISILADRRVTGLVTLGAGLADGHFSHDLAPGESITAPAGFLGIYSGGWDGAAQATRRLVDRRFAPPLPDPSFPWVGFDTWGYGIGIDQNLVNGLIDRAADLGAETFTLDAGWMQRIGDWRPRAGAFDEGIASLANHAHAKGLRFGIWMAFGVADPASDVVQLHPDWVATDDGEPIPGDFGSVQLCLANPDVQAWVLSEIDRIVRDYGVDWLLHDFGVLAACTNPAHGHQSGDGEWATTTGYYAILDEVRRRHPNLVIENCWNGGSMLDFGMVRRHDTSNTSDYNSAFTGRRGVFGTTYVLPPRYAGKYIGDDGTPPDYRFASGLTGGPLIFMGQPTTWDAATTAAAQSAAALFKELRLVLRDGTLTHLSANPVWNGWDGLMYWSAKLREGVLLAFRSESDFETLTLYPSGLRTAASVDLECDTGLGEGTLARGQLTTTDLGPALARDGVELHIPSPNGAAIVHLSAPSAAAPPPRVN